MSVSHIHDLIKGRRRPSIATMHRIKQKTGGEVTFESWMA